MTARWGHITAYEIAPPVRGEVIAGDRGAIFGGLSTDTRQLRPGDLFWALRGEHYDAHDFIGQAVEKGAAGVVVERDARISIAPGREVAVIGVTDTLKALGDFAAWWRHRHRLRVAAVTGSAGKTTTKEMAARILEIGAPTLKNHGNFNNLVGLPLTILTLEDHHRRAVLEMGMNRPGEIARLTEIADPDIGLITNIGRAHLEGLGDIEGVARAKAELLKKMSSKGEVILNGDDELLMRVAAPFRRKTTTYGMGSNNQIRAAALEVMGPGGISFELRYRERAVPVRLRVPGIQNVYNALAAATIALSMKEPEERILRGLESFEGLKGRLTITPLACGATLVDDTYNSNPSSLRFALETLRDMGGDRGRLIVGLGEMLELGDETVAAHREAGAMVAEIGAHHFLAMGEHAQEMISGALSNGLSPDRAERVGDHEEMARVIRELMGERDLILLKGSRRAGLDKVADNLKADAFGGE